MKEINVGDEVRVTGVDRNDLNSLIGETGKVTEVLPATTDLPRSFVVEFDFTIIADPDPSNKWRDNPINYWSFEETRIETI